MIYCSYESHGKKDSAVYISKNALKEAFFFPDTKMLHVIEFKTHGKTYEERKESVRGLAIDFQYAYSDVPDGLTLGEYAMVCDWFRDMGKRYGLLEEFEENAII